MSVIVYAFRYSEGIFFNKKTGNLCLKGTANE